MTPIFGHLYGGRVGDLLIRPMSDDDVPVAERLSAEAFYAEDVARPSPGLVAALRSPERAKNWVVRSRHLVATDPAGCWVAEDHHGMVGFATSFRREGTWCLATFAVRPGRQGEGVGRRLLDTALEHSRGCLQGMLSASSDPKALRRYHQAGFALHPQMYLTGVVDHSAVPAVEKVREAGSGERDLLDSVDRFTRGAAHGPDHEHLARLGRLLVSDTTTGSGYAYTDGSSVALLAATNRRTATRLLWAALADAGERFSISHVTAANAWAIDVGMAARLELYTEGYLGLRSMAPPTPYLHNGALL